jgi:Raf kinase inhibitor-like YbhB/YbcL family protein
MLLLYHIKYILSIYIVHFIFFVIGLKKEQGAFMKIESSEFKDSQRIPDKFTCDGDDINPPLEISDVPDKAQSLSLILDDPDSPSGKFTHWLVFNISSETKKIEENSLSELLMQGKNDFGNKNYGGPCPHGGTHRYVFELFALDVNLDLAPGSSREKLEQAMEGHIIERAKLVGTYSR